METEAGMSREAWRRAMDSSDLANMRRWRRSQNTTEGDGSTTGTGRHTAGAGDRLTGTGDDIAGTGYYLTGTAGTRWRSCTAGAAKGGW
ncbi:hypothetical protein Tco_1547629 [Tanacetum coccineum]